MSDYKDFTIVFINKTDQAETVSWPTPYYTWISIEGLPCSDVDVPAGGQVTAKIEIQFKGGCNPANDYYIGGSKKMAMVGHGGETSANQITFQALPSSDPRIGVEGANAQGSRTWGLKGGVPQPEITVELNICTI